MSESLGRKHIPSPSNFKKVDYEVQNVENKVSTLAENFNAKTNVATQQEFSTFSTDVYDSQKAHALQDVINKKEAGSNSITSNDSFNDISKKILKKDKKNFTPERIEKCIKDLSIFYTSGIEDLSIKLIKYLQLSEKSIKDSLVDPYELKIKFLFVEEIFKKVIKNKKNKLKDLNKKIKHVNLDYLGKVKKSEILSKITDLNKSITFDEVKLEFINKFKQKSFQHIRTYLNDVRKSVDRSNLLSNMKNNLTKSMSSILRKDSFAIVGDLPWNNDDSFSQIVQGNIDSPGVGFEITDDDLIPMEESSIKHLPSTSRNSFILNSSDNKFSMIEWVRKNPLKALGYGLLGVCAAPFATAAVVTVGSVAIVSNTVKYSGLITFGALKSASNLALMIPNMDGLIPNYSDLGEENYFFSNLVAGIAAGVGTVAVAARSPYLIGKESVKDTKEFFFNGNINNFLGMKNSSIPSIVQDYILTGNTDDDDNKLWLDSMLYAALFDKNDIDQ